MNINKSNNFKFGAYNGEFGAIGISHLGLCVASKDCMVVYDSVNEELVDVDMVNVQNNNMLFMMPVALDKVEVGDIIINNSTPVFVTKITDAKKGTKFEVIDPVSGEQKIVLPIKNMFGFDFVTKIVSLFGNIFKNADASPENPFGSSLLPLMLMGDNKDNDMFSTMMMVNMMSGGKNNMFGSMDPNMMMLMMLSKNKGGSNDNDFFTMMMLQNLMTPNQNKDNTVQQ